MYDIVISRTPADRVAGIDTQKDAAVRFLQGEKVVSDSFEDLVLPEDEKNDDDDSRMMIIRAEKT